VKKMIIASVCAVAIASVGVFAAVTFDPATGTGFAGKGDVQLALGLNNAQLQAQAASLAFTYDGTTVTEVTWECTNASNEKVQERERTTTTSTQGVVSAVARVKNQITGFNLSGYSGSSSSTSSSEGPAINSCPNTAGSWSLTSPAGDPVVVSETGGLFVNGVALQ
jgi:hypothetical protein